ncbi:sulfite exporter TauE/SafE family protein [Pedobacter sp. N23S346]|uniref:sulfite exporter TauE/SafE family protein n=1 Tax=Pedobacter sp. N23S346 TaxID=3402750 RepID=UPI003AC328B2
MEIIGFALGLLIGISLGLIGSGGSILTIPILVYVMHISPSQATVYSLFIVGISALMGSIKGARENLLDYRIALYFGLPSVISIFMMRKFFIPLLPEKFFTILDFTVTRDIFIMLAFAVLMILASFSMIGKNPTADLTSVNATKINIAGKGIFVGLLTGFVGVGGGFLIIPTLIFSAKLPMKNAVATSLVIISLNSLIGFAGSLTDSNIDWSFLLAFTALAVIGIFAGMFLSKKMSNEKLKPAFGWFVLITGIYILIKELIFK